MRFPPCLIKLLINNQYINRVCYFWERNDDLLSGSQRTWPSYRNTCCPLSCTGNILLAFHQEYESPTVILQGLPWSPHCSYISDYTWYWHGFDMVETVFRIFENNFEGSSLLCFVPWGMYIFIFINIYTVQSPRYSYRVSRFCYICAVLILRYSWGFPRFVTFVLTKFSGIVTGSQVLLHLYRPKSEV